MTPKARPEFAFTLLQIPIFAPVGTDTALRGIAHHRPLHPTQTCHNIRSASPVEVITSNGLISRAPSDAKPV